MFARRMVEAGGIRRAEEQVALRERLVWLINAYEVSAAIGAFARLSVADVLGEGPATVESLAAQVGADRLALERVLRSLADVGVVERLDDGRFGLTELGGLLRADRPDSLRLGAIVSTEDWLWRAYGHATHSLRTGLPGFDVAHGRGFWEYLASDPAAAEVFNGYMAQSVSLRAQAFARVYDFSAIESLVDVGGGHGALVSAVLVAHPHMRGVVFDQPSVVAGTAERLAAAGVADRCEVVGGDFFEGVPAGGDVYVLSWIIHDWYDEDAVRILRNVRAAGGDRGRLLLIELVVPAGDEPHVAKNMDLTMLVAVGGRERTEAEYRDLYARAGFELTRVLPLESLPWSVIEGVPDRGGWVGGS